MNVEDLDIKEMIGNAGKILSEHERKKGVLIHTLQKIQQDYGYLPEDVLETLSRKLSLPLAEIYSVATFFKTFHFSPRGRNIINICVGTACHVKGNKEIISTIENAFKVKVGETANDMSITVETVGCVGCCAIAPVVVVNSSEIVGDLNIQKTTSLVNEIKDGAFEGGIRDETD